MGTKLVWNSSQIKIANFLLKDMTVDEVVVETESGKSTVQKVKTALKEGQKPPDLAAAAAIAKEKEQGGAGGSGDSGNGDKGGTKKEKQTLIKAATGLKLVPISVQCALTPIMQTGKMCAEREWGWQPDMPWENFLDTCVINFFRDRGFELGAYVRIEDGNNETTTSQLTSSQLTSQVKAWKELNEQEAAIKDIELAEAMIT